MHSTLEAKPRRLRWLWIPILVLLGLAVYIYRTKSSAAARTDAVSSDRGSKKGGRGGEGGATPVVAVHAARGNIGIYLNGLGSATPIYTVIVRSRVDGELINVSYQEGELVQKGAKLMEIDPRPFQVQLAQAEAQLAKDQALLENARLDLNRYTTLLQQNAIPEQQVA